MADLENTNASVDTTTENPSVTETGSTAPTDAESSTKSAQEMLAEACKISNTKLQFRRGNNNC